MAAECSYPAPVRDLMTSQVPLKVSLMSITDISHVGRTLLWRTKLDPTTHGRMLVNFYPD